MVQQKEKGRAAPQPARAGRLSALGNILATQGLFKDMTGLEGNQHLAASTLEQTVKAYGMNADLTKGIMAKAQQEYYANNGNKIIDSINKSGLDDAKKKELKEKALQQMIGATQQEQPQGERDAADYAARAAAIQNDPTLSDEQKRDATVALAKGMTGDKESSVSPQHYAAHLGTGGSGRFYPNGQPSELNVGDLNHTAPPTPPQKFISSGTGSSMIPNPLYDEQREQYEQDLLDWQAVNGAGGALHPVLPDFKIPITTNLANAINRYNFTDTPVSLQDFIAILQNIESTAPLSTMSINEKITQFRKVFYNTQGWNTQLISNTSNILLQISQPNIDLLRSSRYVNVNDSIVDISHVFAGMDAANHRGIVGVNYLYYISDNVSATTWLGDLGSVMGELAYTHPSLASDLSVWQRTIDQNASPIDIIGDIDGFVLGNMLDNVSTNLYTNIYALLSNYYQTNDTITKRIVKFADYSGLGTWNGNEFKSENAWKEAEKSNIQKSAKLYAILNNRSLAPFISPSAFLADDTAKFILTVFISSLKTALL